MSVNESHLDMVERLLREMPGGLHPLWRMALEHERERLHADMKESVIADAIAFYKALQHPIMSDDCLDEHNRLFGIEGSVVKLLRYRDSVTPQPSPPPDQET